MPLTEEQKKRMEENRKRALELQKRRKLEQAQKLEDVSGSEGKKHGRDGNEVVDVKRLKREEQDDINKSELSEEDLDLEEFEEGASELVTKKEAKKMYCLPEGTLAVCTVVEKDNPHHKGWAKMKLYNRSELRSRARKRFGGKEGLIAERRKREDERFRNDIEKTKDIFKK